MNSIDVIIDVISCNEKIKSLRFFNFSTATKLQDRAFNIEQRDFDLVNQAIKIKINSKTRFWSTLFSVFINKNTHSYSLIKESLYHQPNKNYIYLEINNINELRNYSESNLALNSKVIMLDGCTKHIPLLDFKVPYNENNNALVISCIQALDLTGYIINSGKSYHFIGNKLITESDLLDLLAKFIFLDPISDTAWAAHQIIERSSSLRVSKKNGMPPTVIAKI